MENSRRGQAGLFIVLNLTIVFALLGLAVDLGYANFRRSAAQAAADSAVMAAGVYARQNGFTCGVNGVLCSGATNCAYPNTTPAVNNFQVGCLYAHVNGFDNTGSQTVSLQGNTTAPPGLTGNSPAYWVKATVTEKTFDLFAVAGGIKSLTVKASATAGITSSAPAGCVYALSPNASPAITVAGSASVTSGCGLFINSTATPSLSVGGSASLHAPEILLNGGGYTLGSSAVLSPTPLTTGGAVTDPLASLPMPTVGACTQTGLYSLQGSATATLNPGVYCGGISLAGSAWVTLNPGTYIINGGGINMGGSSRVTGTGVTIFNTGNAQYPAAPISITASGTTTLSAPTSGTYQGMLFIQDRNLTYNQTNMITGSNTTTFTGTLYFPTTAVSYRGSSTGTYNAIIANTVTFVGATNIKNDPTGFYTGTGSTSTSLIQ